MSKEPKERSRAAEARFARFLARRFVRARRQGFLSVISLVSALGFTVGVASLVVVLALMTGFQEDFVGRILGSNAHIVVFPADGSTTIPEYESQLAAMEAVDGVAAAEATVQGFGGIIGPTGVAQWTLVTGVDPSRAGRVTAIEREMVTGHLADLAASTASGRPGIVIGDVLARRLGALPGDTVRLMVPRPRLTPWGPSIQQPAFEIVGTFETGYQEYDESWSFIAFEHGLTTFGADGAHRLQARVDDVRAIDDRKAALEDVLGERFQVRSVLEYNQSLLSALKIEKLMMSFAVGLIVLVAALGVVSTLVLTVTQKVREIGVLIALGASRAGVLRIFVFQGLAMGVVGTILGVVIGVSLAVVLDRFQLIRLDPEIYFLPHLPFTVLPGDLLLIVVAALSVSLIATIYPAWKAASLDPVEALRRD